MPYIGKSSDGFGIRERYRYSASGSQTAFTGSDLDSKTLQFDSGSLLDVYLNGVLLDTADYNTSTANTVTLTSGATASDEVMIVVYDVFSLSDAMPKTGGTFTGGITGTTGTFSGDVSLDGGDFVFNESGASKDFRIEGDTNTNLFIVDGSEDDIGIGQAPSFTSGNGVHLADNYKIGFGAGGNSRPDFQLGYDTTVDRLLLACGFGADTGDIQVTSGGTIGTTSGCFRSSPNDTFHNGAGTTGAGLTTGDFCEFTQNKNEFILMLKNTNASSSQSHGLYIAHATNHFDATSIFIQCVFSSYNRFLVYSNGASYNASNTWGNISDERLKSDITDAKSQWNDIKSIKIRNFKKYDTGDLVQLGVVAQEVEKVSPSLIDKVEPSVGDVEHNSDFGSVYKDGDDIPEGKKVGDVNQKEPVKAIKYSVLYMKAVKALQEAMERIETLEAKVKALEEA